MSIVSEDLIEVSTWSLKYKKKGHSSSTASRLLNLVGSEMMGIDCE